MRRRRGPGRPAPIARAPALAALAMLAAAVLAGAGSAAAQRSLLYESFEADIAVQSGGSLLVTETLRPRFTGEWNGILRTVALQHTTAAGRREQLAVRLISATDEQGGALRHESTRVAGGQEFRVWVPNARDRTATVVLTYRVDGAIRYLAADSSAGLPEYDELYWQVTGTDSEVPIRSASARIQLPPGATMLQSAAYVGSAGSRTPANVWAISDGIQAGPAGPLAPREGLTVAVAWPAGAVAVPAGTQRSLAVDLGPGGVAGPSAAEQLMSGGANPLAAWPLLLPFLVFYLAYRSWDRRGRDPKGRAVTVHWEPPPALRPAEAGTLVDHQPEMHDIIAILVDLAVRGYVVIVEREKEGILSFGKDYAFHLMKPRHEWQELTAYECRFLEGLFESSKGEMLAALGGQEGLVGRLVQTLAGRPAAQDAPDGAVDSVLLSDLKNEFYKEIPKIRNGVLDELVEKGYYVRRPDKVRGNWLLLAGVTALAALFGLFGSAARSPSGILFMVSMLTAGGVSTLTLIVFAFLMPARTEKGARTREAALGFGRFLERVESPRYKRMITSPDQFEEYLPYAMAFRCEEKWARAFDDLLSTPPDWYHGHRGVFRPSAFAHDLGAMATTASTAMTSSPGSSSGSGGGGSVGGGSGGGGVGGF